VNSVQYEIAETVLKKNLRRNSRGNLHESQGGLSELSLLRSDRSRGSQTGGPSHMSRSQKQLKGGHQT
jgi:hypothetical protein